MKPSVASKPKAKAKTKAKACKKGNVAARAEQSSVTAAAEVPAPEPVPSHDSTVGAQTAKEDGDVSNAGHQKKLKEMFSSMQAAAIALASERNSVGMDVIHYIGAPTRHFYSHIQECVRGGPHQVRIFYANLATGQMHKASVEIWTQLQNAEVLKTCGVILERSFLMEDEILEGESLVMEQSSIVALLDDCALSLIAERCDEAITHEHDYVSKCAGLLHPDEQQRQQTLADLKCQAHAFRRATRETGSPVIQSIISKSNFNGSVEKAIWAGCFFTLCCFIGANHSIFNLNHPIASGPREPFAASRFPNHSTDCRKHNIGCVSIIRQLLVVRAGFSKPSCA